MIKNKSQTRNNIDCDQSTVYSSHVIFSKSFRSFSLYPPLRNKCPISYCAPRVRGQSMVCVYVCTQSLCAYIKWTEQCVSENMVVWIFQNVLQPPSWIWSNRKWCRSIRRFRKPHPRTKQEGDRLTRCRVMAIWNFCKMRERSLLGRSSIFILLTLIS